MDSFFFSKHMYSSVDDEKMWCNELNDNLYFSHRKTVIRAV